MKKKNIFLLLVTLCLCIFAQAQMLSVYELSSPNGQLVLTVENGRVLQYSLSLEGRSVIHPSDICMTMQNGNIWGKNGEVVGTSTSSTSEKVYPVAGNYRELTDHYNELSLKFKDGYSVIFRMYNEGMAYRFCGNLPEQDSLIVADEEASFNLADDLLEPFRPLVDLYAFRFVESEEEYLTKEMRRELVQLLNCNIRSGKEIHSVNHAIEREVQSLSRCFEDASAVLLLPELMPLQAHAYE